MSQNDTLRLIARWNWDQDPATDQPASLRWSDGRPATSADWERADTSTQSDPAIEYGPDGREVAVEFGYQVRREAGRG